ncbi:MAG: phosphotransferase [Cellulosilyticaceae bacterium]
MLQPILVIMAAGMGSRYGGPKQIDPVGQNGELIIDFSIYDAVKAGFKKVVFIIKKDIEADFKEAVGDRLAKIIDVQYAYQELDLLPEGYSRPADRTKPWGTAHAIMCAKDLIDAPFAVINADDFYGYTAFKEMYDFLSQVDDCSSYSFAMVGYPLKNTLTEHGHVARGICQVKNEQLAHITERTHIAYHEDKVQFLENDCWTPLSEESVVSMNLWGFTPRLFDAMEQDFCAFLDQGLSSNPLKCEFFLPSVVDGLIKTNQATVTVLNSTDHWYGVTYKEDKPRVVEAIAQLQKDALYPQKLWPSPFMAAALAFQFEGLILSIEPTGNGHINDTYLVTTTAKPRYILQRINHRIMKDPVKLMHNIESVLLHLNNKLKGANDVDLSREILTLIPTHTGESLHQDGRGDFWRSYLFIEDTISYDIVPNAEVFYSCGKKFGQFQQLLSDFDASSLHEIIPNFHNTPVRYANFSAALECDALSRAEDIQDEIQFVLERQSDTHYLLDQLKSGILPLRVTHNDTKANNILIDAQTDKALCVIDLDTIMPGLSAYDFGDCIRSGANAAAEDETDLSKVYIVTELFESLAKGFIESVGTSFSKEEVLSLLMGAKMMTFECGMRFLTDYLEGDHYFKIHRPQHNLDRARTQFKLVADIEHKWDELTAILTQFISHS